MNLIIVKSCTENTKGTAGSRKHYCGDGFKQEAPLKGSLIEGAKSKDSFLNLDKGEASQAEVLQVKYEIMKQAVASSPKVNLECMGKRLASQLDSGSMVSLVQQSYFDQNIKPKLGPARGPETNLHNLFDLKGANGGDIPITKYIEMDVTFLGCRMQKVGFLVVKDPIDLLQTKKKTKLPGIISWNLIKLAYQEFIKKHPVEVYNSFQCPQNVDPLLYSQLCVYYYTDVRPVVVNEVIEGDCVYIKSIATNLDGEVVYKKTPKF